MPSGDQWTFPIADTNKDLVRCTAKIDGRPVTRTQLIRGLAGCVDCRRALVERLAGLDAPQVYWETPPLDRASQDQPFEFVVVEADLHRPANPAPFTEFLDRGDQVVTFSNLGGDATLVAPTDLGGDVNYNYLLSFLRSAPPAQVDALWRAVGVAVAERLSDRPVWVSTSGGGVAWLHIRLDDVPKYYTHGPYRSPPTRQA